jgi:hypothetical protein
MNYLLILLLALSPLLPASQSGPGKGDYLAVSVSGFNVSNYIYRNGTVYYGYEPDRKKVQNKYNRDVKTVGELFDMADNASMEKMKSLEEKILTLGPGVYNFKVIEYHKGDTTIRICWDTQNITDPDSRRLNDIDKKMTEFW